MSSRSGLSLRDFVQIVDLRTKIVSVSSLLIGTAWAWHSAGVFDAATFALMLVATLLVDMGTTSFNSYYDFVQGVDTVATDVERWKALVQRPIAPAAALHLAWLLFGLAAVAGLVLGVRLGTGVVVVVGATCMTVGLLYSAGPLPIARLPVGEFFAGGMLGSVLIALAAYVQTRAVDARVLWLGAPSALLIATILSVNNACDIEGDRRAGRRTLAILLGLPRAERLIHLQALATLGLAVALVPLGVLHAASLLPLALVAWLGLRELQAMHRRGYSHATKSACMAGISRVFLVYTLAVLASLGIPGLLH